MVINGYPQINPEILLKNEINDIVSIQDTLWICTGDGILIKASTSGVILDTITLIPDEKDNALYAIVVDKTGCKWIATEGKGVFCISGDSVLNFTTKDGLAFDCTFSIAVDKQNRK